MPVLEEETENPRGNQRLPTATQHYRARSTPKPGAAAPPSAPRVGAKPVTPEGRPGHGRRSAGSWPGSELNAGPHQTRPSAPQELRFPSATIFLTSLREVIPAARREAEASGAEPPGTAEPRRLRPNPAPFPPPLRLRPARGPGRPPAPPHSPSAPPRTAPRK